MRRDDAAGLVDALEALLRKEIAALEAGDFAALLDNGERKAQLGAEIEARLSQSPEAVPHERLRDLRALIQTDADRLRHAMLAAGDLAGEVRRIRDRHGLKGLYGPGGTARGANATMPNLVDKSC